MAKVSEIISVILGGFSVFLLLGATTSVNQGWIKGAASLVDMAVHLIVIIIATPFLLNVIYKYEVIQKWYRNIILIESFLNAFFLFTAIIQLNKIGSNAGIFIIAVPLELLPFLLFYKKRYKVGGIWAE